MPLIKKRATPKNYPLKHDALEAMTTAVTKMADVLGSQKTASHGLEKLSVPTWDGNRKSYATWKSEFNCWMYKVQTGRRRTAAKTKTSVTKKLFLV